MDIFNFLLEASGGKVSETVRATHVRPDRETSGPRSLSRPVADQPVSSRRQQLIRRCGGSTARNSQRVRDAADRRGYERTNIECNVTCIRNDRTRFAARAVDISLGGMCIQSHQGVKAGEHLTIFAVLPGSPEILQLPVTVRWQRPGEFGVQFVPLPLKETLAVSRHLPGKV